MFMCYHNDMIITSTSNSQVKEIKKLKKEKGFLFLDNPKLIEEAKVSGEEFEVVVFEEGKEKKFENLLCENNLIVSSDVFKSLSSAENSQGVLGVVKFKKRPFKPPSGNFLVLDEVQDPGNVGTLVRSALAFGFEDIYLINCASITNEKVARSTMGAIFKTRVYELSREEFVFFFKGKNLYSGEMNGEDISKVELKFPVGIIVGNEGNGVSKQLKEISKSVAIRMNDGVESLNAGVAGSILMFKIMEKEN